MPRAPALAAVTPEQLLSACLEGDEAAWREFLRRYGNLLYSVALKTGASYGDAEEIVQFAVVAIYEKLATLRSPARLVPWLIGLTRRQALYYLRKRRREVQREDDDGNGPGGELVDTAPLPPEALESLQRGQMLHEALAELRPRCRELLRALYIADPPWAYQDLVERLGIPIGSIGPTRARCLETLRELVAAREGAPDA